MNYTRINVVLIHCIYLSLHKNLAGMRASKLAEDDAKVLIDLLLSVVYSPKVNCRFPESDSFEKYES